MSLINKTLEDFKTNTYDLIILGSGCAGLCAGIYAGRAQLSTLILEHHILGGQIATTNDIGNYPALPDVSGPDLIQRMLDQAKSFGAEYLPCQVKEVKLTGDVKEIITESATFKSYGVIVATGATPKLAGFSGEKTFLGRGVGYCATCDGFFYQDKDIFVIGGGNSAAEESLYLTRFGKQVTMVVRKDYLRCEKTTANKVLNHPKIKIWFNTELTSVSGERNLKSATFKNNQTGETSTYEVSPEDGIFGVFVFMGYQPASGLFKENLDLDENGYILTDEQMKTGVNGVYAAGDVRPKTLRQIVTATADGAIAATAAETYILEQKERLGISEKTVHKPLTPTNSPESLLSQEIQDQVQGLFEKLEKDCVLVMAGTSDDPKTKELSDLLSEICALSPKLSLKQYSPTDTDCPISFERTPAFALCSAEGAYSGVKFSGIPGGHELNSLVFSVLNFSGNGQAISEKNEARIAALKKTEIQIAVTLSCHFCPEVVIAAHHIALLNPNIEAEMVDAGLFPDFRDEHQIMSVPTLILNGKAVLFGAQSMENILDAMEQE